VAQPGLGRRGGEHPLTKKTLEPRQEGLQIVTKDKPSGSYLDGAGAAFHARNLLAAQYHPSLSAASHEACARPSPTFALCCRLVFCFFRDPSAFSRPD